MYFIITIQYLSVFNNRGISFYQITFRRATFQTYSLDSYAEGKESAV